ncbi:MAG: S41 family peptidase [Candidatus Peribacteraceae bacterium]|nr:S41 family peptidase [Candidatus Peribacteraceae bacterium]
MRSSTRARASSAVVFDPTRAAVRVFTGSVLTLAVFVLSALGGDVAGAQQGVARGDFLRAAVEALRLPLDQADVPYPDVPASLLPYVGAAQKRGALAAFSPGATIDLQRAITRGEALQVLVKLTGEKTSGKLTRSYSDVRTAAQKEAVLVALRQRWMRPLRNALFGMDVTLTPSEQRTLLKKASTSGTVRVVPPEPQTIRINIDGSAQSLPKEEVLQTVWDLLNRQYLYKEKINGNEAGYRSVESLVESLEDPYTVFFRPSTAKEFQTQLQGEVTGIGAQVDQKDGILIIIAPLHGSPAERAGLQGGDEILSVNGESITGLPYEEAVSKVRGPKGTAANLHIRRNGTEFDVQVVRDTVRIDDLRVTYEGDIPVVKLTQFGQSVDRDFRKLMQDVALKNPRGLVLDLRNNPGGYLDAAGTAVSAFLPDRTPYVVIETATSSEPEVTNGKPVISSDTRMVVLVNKGSASAAEIVAGALQDHKRATVVGETTFGKGTVQQLISFTDGSSLKMTIAEWKTPNGRKIDGTGVTPDIAIASSTTTDLQLQRALELLR